MKNPTIKVIAVLVVTGTLAAVAMAATHARRSNQLAGCTNNLRQIDGAKDQFAMDHGLTNGATVTFREIFTEDCVPRRWPACPTGHAGTQSTNLNDATRCYDLGPIGTDPRCRILPDDHVMAPTPPTPPAPRYVRPLTAQAGPTTASRGS